MKFYYLRRRLCTNHVDRGQVHLFQFSKRDKKKKKKHQTKDRMKIIIERE